MTLTVACSVRAGPVEPFAVILRCDGGAGLCCRPVHMQLWLLRKRTAHVLHAYECLLRNVMPGHVT
jgi:hypothetical protein